MEGNGEWMTEQALFIRQMENIKNAKPYQDSPLILLLEYDGTPSRM